MYVDGAKRRTEQDTNSGGLAVILRGDVHMMNTVLVTRKLYRVSSFDPKLIEPFDVTELAKEIGVTREKVGTETINGEVCDKYHYSSDTGKEKGSTKSGESHGSASGFIWISQSTHLPVKSQTATATTTPTVTATASDTATSTATATPTATKSQTATPTVSPTAARCWARAIGVAGCVGD